MDGSVRLSSLVGHQRDHPAAGVGLFRGGNSVPYRGVGGAPRLWSEPHYSRSDLSNGGASVKTTKQIRKGVTVSVVVSEEPMTDLDRWVQQYAEMVAENAGITLASRAKAA